MSELSIERPARRFLHICYCCDDAAAVSDFFVEGLAMTTTSPAREPCSIAPTEVELSGTPVPDMWITFVSDPNGIPFEFVQRPRSAFK